ncbi:hypothetical protein [Marivirga arenosa]|uniref:Lipoprotein n=1 Tax=Marivirga arenosa TaxID=3059076 RepID=A0AA49GEM2_9BACT|nr:MULTISPECIES: hypothetical protein [unclassified Marivirga]WKK80459.1 hypothetical protein QYS47_25455 [Marivirga sp. BKB1-2]WKK84585.2 hypothetical protein QYS48_20955 [Marivirga sp. ABR2-2]
MKILSKLFLGLFIMSILSCESLPQLEGIDLDAWKQDQDGCNENRIKQIDLLLSQKDKLKGLSQNEMIELLGVADKHQLYERSQKFFIYYLEPNENCSNYSEGYLKALYIRFNSLDQAVDFNIQKVK